MVFGWCRLLPRIVNDAVWYSRVIHICHSPHLFRYMAPIEPKFAVESNFPFSGYLIRPHLSWLLTLVCYIWPNDIVTFDRHRSQVNGSNRTSIYQSTNFRFNIFLNWSLMTFDLINNGFYINLYAGSNKQNRHSHPTLNNYQTKQ